MLASAAVGSFVGPAWAEEAQRSPRHSEFLPSLRVPRFTRNGAKVPIVVEMAQPMTAGHHVTSVRVTNANDPISSKGTFRFTPANGRVYLAFQARMHEGTSVVSATMECNLHGTRSVTGPIEIPAGAGGCVGTGPPAAGRTQGPDIHAPVIRIPALVERGSVRHDEFIHVQVKMRHPNRTGLVFRDGKFVQESEPLHLDTLEVLYDGEPVSEFAMTSALSDDPLITFGLLARRTGRLQVVVTNSRGQRFDAEHELRVA